MPEIGDVGAIAQQIKARIKHIEDQLKQHHVLTDELERLRAVSTMLTKVAKTGELAKAERGYKLPQ